MADWRTSRSAVIDLDTAIAYHQSALELRPPGHPDRSSSFHNLGSALRTRFEQAGDRDDLDNAIAYQKSALELRSPGHPDRSKSLINLANALLARFKQAGDRADLENAIACYQDALELTPPGHPDRASSFSNLGDTLLIRFEQVGDRADLENAIAYHQSALELRPPGHPDRYSSFNNLANALLTRFEQVGDRADLDNAIAYYQDAPKLIPPGHPDRSSRLNSLANALLTRFEQVGDRADLENAIAYHQSALELRPPGHPDRSSRLNNLANALLTRFEQAEDRADLDNAISYYQGSMELTPPVHPNRSSRLSTLANALITRLEQGNVSNAIAQFTSTSTMLDDRHEIINLLQTAASRISGGPPARRLQAALDWVNIAVKWSEPSALKGYRVALELLETVLATSRSLESRHVRITSLETLTLAVDGAAFAFDVGQRETAVELLEQGRSVLLAQAGKYRTRVEDLRVVDPNLADEFQAASQLMEKSVMSNGTRAIESSSIIGSDDVVARYSKLSEKWTMTVDRIRSLKGFESFLLPTPFATLRAAAAHGPVIILNISKRRSDAIFLHSHNEPLLVPLPDATLAALTRMTAGANAKTPRSDFEDLLKETWDRLVRPVVQALQNDLQLAKGSRIWWCPTSQASRLPLHAAGINARRDQSLPNIYISSYTSTLSALIRARRGIPEVRTAAPNLLVIGQANTPEQTPLPSITSEVDSIASVVPCTTTITGFDCTCEAVLKAMQQHDWMHIACHGHVDQDHPFRSHFSLQNGPMTLLDIAAQSLPNGELAFLAACHSAEGSIDRPDEVLHLTAGLQFAGVRSVVGTLWAMSDEIGPIISRAFYSNLIDDTGITAGSSAHALHRAVSELRRLKPSIPSSKWACFVHYGC